VIEILLLLQGRHHLTETAIVPSPEHHQQVHPAAAIPPQPFHLLRVRLVRQTRLHSLQHSRVVATQLSLRLLGHEAVVAAGLRMIRHATFLVLPGAVAPGV
jgi:hypothetical protein